MAGNALNLHMTDLGLIPDIPYALVSTARSNSLSTESEIIPDQYQICPLPK